MVDFDKLLQGETKPVRRKRSELVGFELGCKFGHGGAEGLSRNDAGTIVAKPVDVPLFEDAEGKPQALKEPVLQAGFNAIVESMHLLDPEATYKRLRAALKVGVEARNDKGKLREALDEAEDNAREAHLLFCNAVVEAERYDIDAAPVFGTMWNNATEWLEERENPEEEEEPERGKRKRGKARKNITNEDVRAKAAAMYPDQWRRHHIGLKRVKMMVEHMKELADLWAQRCKTLNTLLGTAR